jgi:hypothetical protein
MRPEVMTREGACPNPGLAHENELVAGSEELIFEQSNLLEAPEHLSGPSIVHNRVKERSQ